MKNIQVIDGAENCTYDIYSLDDESFGIIFPNNQDIEFSEDVLERIGSEEATRIFSILWSKRADKKKITGINGTLFFGLYFKKQYYPSKKENEMVVIL
jgi:hypothetical protein